MANSELSNQRSKRKRPPPPSTAPWLVFPHGKDRKYQTFSDIFEDSNKCFKKFIPELTTKQFWQKNSNQGWVVALKFNDGDTNFDDRELILWNPVSLETIRLPRVPDLVRLSTSSSFGNVDYDSMVYILYYGGESLDVLIYCHPGEKQWRKHEFVDVGESFGSILYYKGKLFIMCLRNAYIGIAIQRGSGIGDDETLSVNDVISIASKSRLELVAGGLECRSQSYYIECFGEVFRIYRNSFPRGIYENCVTSILVWKLDFSSMTWVEVKSMDDYVFFLSNNSQVSCLASDLGLSKGFVYYTHDEEMSLYRYDLEDDSILLSLPCPDLPAPWCAPDWLMISATPRNYGPECKRRKLMNLASGTRRW